MTPKTSHYQAQFLSFQPFPQLGTIFAIVLKKYQGLSLIMANKFPFFPQLDAMDCAAACLRMVSRVHGKFVSIEEVRSLTHISREGVSIADLTDGAEKLGFQTLVAQINPEQLSEMPTPAILWWNQEHFVVLYEILKNDFRIADPAVGIVNIKKEEFFSKWIMPDDHRKNTGIIILLEPTAEFLNEDNKVDKSQGIFSLFYKSGKFKNLIIQLIIGFFVGSIISVIIPYLIQSMVDIGVFTRDLNFILIIGIAYFVLFVSQLGLEFIRGWILLHIGARINLSLVSEFLQKVTKLPMSFFESRLQGDILQRVYDNERIEKFLTSDALFTLFSMIHILVFGSLLAWYNFYFFLVFIVCSILSMVFGIFIFSQRKILDQQRFEISSQSQHLILQILNGISDLKLHNAERQKTTQFESSQAKLFRNSEKYLANDQWFRATTGLINHIQNLAILIIGAYSVVNQKMSFGGLLAIQYILGQLNAPISQMLGFFRAYQDASISLERIQQIRDTPQEGNESSLNLEIPKSGDLTLDQVSFRYGSEYSTKVLSGITLHFPRGKTSAIVGTSGSGKTTLLKLLLGFFPATEGKIFLGDYNLNDLHSKTWRSQCGVVMQDGYLFHDTIARNIALGKDQIDIQKLLEVTKLVNLNGFIESLPSGLNTKVGANGVGLSQGQKQRVLLARALYKDPEFLFLDEATNSLDAYNELLIMENLLEYFDKRNANRNPCTVIIVAHRLSTVRHADKIFVLEQGELVEQGDHLSLIEAEGAYYYLVKNQLELGS
jgi:ATP-binding cassette, subfamily B, bacterial